MTQKKMMPYTGKSTTAAQHVHVYLSCSWTLLVHVSQISCSSCHGQMPDLVIMQLICLVRKYTVHPCNCVTQDIHVSQATDFNLHF